MQFDKTTQYCDLAILEAIQRVQIALISGTDVLPLPVCSVPTQGRKRPCVGALSLTIDQHHEGQSTSKCTKKSGQIDDR